MKNLKSLKNYQELSKTQQKNISGGEIVIFLSIGCAFLDVAGTNAFNNGEEELADKYWRQAIDGGCFISL